MDAELIAIQRVRRAVKALPVDAQVRVLQYVVAGFYEAQNARHRAEQERPGNYLGGSTGGQAVRMSEANQAN